MLNEPDLGPGRIDGTLRTATNLSSNQCWDLLRAHATGRFGFVEGGRVMIIPVNYLVHEDGIYFRTAEDGVISRAVPGPQTSFQIDAARPDRNEGWSVLASGDSVKVDDPELLTYLWGRIMPEPWGSGMRNVFICLRPAVLTGRSVRLS
jgi:nitroimidazol reductase NimA-like FMN-containing flavoprotein (pyridoxamine 5'-phosphate oxidase superfamily)